MDKLEGPQGRAPKARGMEHLPREEMLGELGWVRLGNRWLWEHLTDHQSLQGVIKEMDMGSSQRCRMGG